MSVVQDLCPTVRATSDAGDDAGSRSRLADAAPLLSQSNIRLRRLDPEHPRVYAVADMTSQGKRRWWALSTGAETGRLEALYRRAAQDNDRSEDAVEQVATALIHSIVGRVAALLALEGRAWDPGIDNLWIHLDSDVGIDWAGLLDPTLRVIDGDPLSDGPGVVVLPSTAALVMWLAHRCLTSLERVRCELGAYGHLDSDCFWRIVGSAVVGASSFVPVLAGSDRGAGWSRGQALLDAFVSLGRPVRGTLRAMPRRM